MGANEETVESDVRHGEESSSWYRKPRRWVKAALSRTVLRPGRRVRILRGPSAGLRYVIYPDYGLAPMLGGWERSLQELAQSVIRPASTVYDLGGNYGIHSILFSRLVGPSGHVVAFEPFDHLADALELNVRLNSQTNVICVRAAVSSSDGVANFTFGHHNGAGNIVTETSALSVAVRTVSLDSIVFEQLYPSPDFIKIDIEGAEGVALDGAHRVLAECRPVLVIDLHSPEQDIQVGAVLERHGYRARRIEEAEDIEYLSRGWPDPKGVHGQIVAFPADE